MRTPTASTPTNTNKVEGVLDTPRPQGNTAMASATTSANAIRTETASMGHNVFRPDVYRVSEGYLN